MKLFEIGCVMAGVGGILVATGVIIDWITSGSLNIPSFAPACVMISAWIVLLQRRKKGN